MRLQFSGRSTRSTTEHARNAKTVLRHRAKAKPDNCFVRPEMIKYYEVMCGQDGIQPDPIKNSALKQMPPLQTTRNCKSSQGIENYMGPIIPNLRPLTALGCEEFHTYLYGQSSTVYTDHKPLESIYLKQRLPPNSGRMGKENRIRVLFP